MRVSVRVLSWFGVNICVSTRERENEKNALLSVLCERKGCLKSNTTPLLVSTSFTIFP